MKYEIRPDVAKGAYYPSRVADVAAQILNVICQTASLKQARSRGRIERITHYPRA